MTWCDTLDVQVLAAVASQLKYLPKTEVEWGVFRGVNSTDSHLCRKILENGSTVDGCCGANSAVTGRSLFQMSVNTTYGELLEAECSSLVKKMEGLMTTCKPALADLDTALALTLASLPAFPPA